MEKVLNDTIITPRIIHWLHVPGFIQEDKKYELLSFDILIKNYHCSVTEFMEKMTTLSSVYLIFIDIDEIYAQSKETYKDFKEFLKSLKLHLSNNNDRKFILYSYRYDEIETFFFGLNNVFTKNSDNILNARNFAQNFLNAIKSFQVGERATRAHIRIMLYPQTMNKVTFYRFKEPDIPITGYIKDLSISGIGILLMNKMITPVFVPQDELSLSVSFARHIIEIKRAIVKRIDLNENLLGLYFDFNDRTVMTKKNSSDLNDIILTMLKNKF